MDNQHKINLAEVGGKAMVVNQAPKVYADLCTLWDELVVLPAGAQRVRQELLDTVKTKLVAGKYFKLMAGAFIKISAAPGRRDVLEILDMSGLPEGQPALLLLGTLEGWCEALQFVQPSDAAEYGEALAVVLDAEAKVLLIERVGGGAEQANHYS